MSASAGGEFKPYVPASQSPREMTWQGLALGSFLGVLFAASSVYLAIKVGMTVSASIPIAVMSIAIFRAFGKGSILQNTIVQTTGSAGESLAFGVAAALPALLLLGYDIDLWHALLVAGLGGFLGVLMMIPLRQGLIVQEHGKLAYPEGTACGDVLVVGEQGGTNAITVIIGFVAGGLYKIGYSGLHLWREVIGFPLSWASTGKDGKEVTQGYPGGSVSAEISPELLGVGYIIGPKVAGVTFAGGVLSYLILIPAIQFFGSALHVDVNGNPLTDNASAIAGMEPDAVRNAYVLYIGAGAVATGGLISLVRSLPTIIGAFRRGIETLIASQKGLAKTLLRTEQDLPITVVIVGSVLLVLAMWLLPPLEINFFAALLILIFGFFFVTVSARITGEIGSSSNPISGMVVATLLVTCLLFLLLGWTSPTDRFMALTTAAIVGIAASNGGTTAQDLKTAYLVGGTPWKQQVSLFVGVGTSALFIGLTLVVLNDGATVPIPEEHPGVKVTELSTTTMEQTEVAWSADKSALAAAGVEEKDVATALFERRVELRPTGVSYALRSFDEVDAGTIGAIEVSKEGGGSVKIADLGSLGSATSHTYKVGYVRGVDGVPNGKYLVDSAETIQYVVDPGIGGRIEKFMGVELQRYDAPKARLFSLIIDGILTQKLPWALVLLGVFIAIMLELCGVNSLPFAVGVYLPISTSAPIFVGGLVRYAVDRVRRTSDAEAEFSPGVLLSSGYIAGGAIAGVLLAVLAIPGGGAYLGYINLPAWIDHPAITGLTSGDTESLGISVGSNVWGALVFGLLTAGLVWVALRAMSGVGGNGPKVTAPAGAAPSKEAEPPAPPAAG